MRWFAKPGNNRNLVGQIAGAKYWRPPRELPTDKHSHGPVFLNTSRLIMARVDLRAVAQLMGHSTIQMTMRYAHLAPEHTQAEVDRLISSEQLVTKSVTGKTGRTR